MVQYFSNLAGKDMVMDTLHKIPESELIVNADGSIYHLNLTPSQITDTIITVGDPNRVPMVSKYFDEVELKTKKREFTTHIGTLNKKRLMVISTGIGTDNIDIVLNELDALANIDLVNRSVNEELKQFKIFRIGTCGGLQSDIPLNSFVVSEVAIGMDGLMQFYDFHPSEEEKKLALDFRDQALGGTNFILPYVVCGSEPLLKMFDNKFIKGITVTCSGFYGPQARQLRAPILLPGLLNKLSAFRFEKKRIANFEMETSGLYGLSKLLGHQCVSLSAVVANRITNEFSKDHEETMEKLIQAALEKIVE